MGRLRIQSGSLKGRSIEVPEVGVRPTLGRIRETFFSWLRPSLPGSRCLDLFAGSGVLGFEALSEGAKHVVFVDCERACLQAIEKNAKDFGVLDRVSLVQASAPNLDALSGQSFDCVFLDPPYDQSYTMLSESALWLSEAGALSQGACVVGEWGKGDEPKVPITWQCLRLKQTKHLIPHLPKS